MKIATLLLSFCWWLGAKAQTTEAPNLFIITIDGLRWQEVFAGADSALLHDGRFTHDTSLAKALFWAATPQERRAQLLPFCWNVIAKQGQLLGNRAFGNEVNVSNLYKISYAGYNELLTGTTDLRLFSNAKKYNTHRNVLEKLNAMPDYRGRIAAFSSWEVFPYILNQPHNGLPVNSGYDTATTAGETMAQAVQRQGVALKGATRYDLLTFVTAMDYIRQQRPKVVLLGFGEADEFAHHGRYDAYLQSAQQFDRLLQELWYWVQTTPGYANNTSFVITTDHGRGKKGSIGWQGHGALIRGSGEVWRAVIGPAFEARGEVRQAGRLYQKHLPQLVEALLAKPNFGHSNSPSLASAR